MASTEEGRRLTEAHRQQQVAIRAAFLQELWPTWSLLDWSRIDETSPAWTQLVMTLVRAWRGESVNAAASYFDLYRQVEVPSVSTPAPQLEIRNAPEATGARRPDRVTDITPIIESRRQSGNTSRDRSRIDAPHFGEFKPAVLDWGDIDPHVVRSIHSSGPAYLKHLAKRGETEGPAKLKALVTVSGTSSRHVLNGGRDALDELIQADDAAVGWARVTDGDPCAFCAMLASRGAVYKSAMTAGFKAHDHCACTAEPVYDAFADLPGRAQEFQDLWYSATKGFSGKDAINAFRRAYEKQRRPVQTEFSITA